MENTNVLNTNMSIVPVVTLLEKWYAKLNSYIFSGELPHVVITVQRDLKRRDLAWSSTEPVWHDSTGSSEFELNIVAQTLNRPAADIVGALVHEMVHIYNKIHDVKDTSRGGHIHNKDFKSAAESHGLVCKDRDDKVGHGNTVLAPAVLTWAESQPEYVQFDLYRDDDPAKEKPNTRKLFKYVCPDCGAIVRTSKELNILCGDCMKKFELVSSETGE